jgi:DHA1 family multidrug resistance protein-like MFS transporter
MPQLFSSSERSTAANSTQLSFTCFESHLSAETVSRREDGFEGYGADVQEPPLEPIVIQSSTLQSIDPYMATWDSPDDPTNPQNWTIEYKWLVTAVCLIMTVNV